MKRLLLLAALALVGCGHSHHKVENTTVFEDGCPDTNRIVTLARHFNWEEPLRAVTENAYGSNRSAVWLEFGRALDAASAEQLARFSSAELARRIDTVKRGTSQSPYTLAQLLAAKEERDRVGDLRRKRRVLE